MYVFEINSLSAALFAIIFSHSEGCFFTLHIVSFIVQKLLSLIKSHLFIFAFISITLGGASIEDPAVIYVGECLPMFSSRSFIISGPIFRTLIHFEFIFVYGVRKCSSFILLQMVDQFSQHHLLKSKVGQYGPIGTLIPCCWAWTPVQKGTFRATWSRDDRGVQTRNVFIFW